MAPPSLPQELLDQVTDTVATSLTTPEDRATLRTLAATSRQHFLHRAQSHLFRVWRHESPWLGYRQHCIREERPSLHKLVRVVHLSMEEYRAYGSEKDKKWLRRYATLLDEIFGEFENLESVYLDIAGYPDFVGQETIFKLFQPSLVHLIVRRIPNLPLRLLGSLPNLRALICTPNDSVNRHAVVDDGGSRKAQLESLKVIDWASANLSGFLTWYPMESISSTLESLKVKVHNPEHHRDVWSLFAVAGGAPTWTTIEIEYDLGHEDALECFDETIVGRRTLPSFPSLVYFAIQLRVPCVRTIPALEDHAAPTTRSFIRFCTHLLGRNPQPSLTTLKITLADRDTADHLNRVGPQLPSLPSRLTALLRKAHLHEKLDSILSDPSLFPNLRHVRFSIVVWPSGAIPERTLQKYRKSTLLTLDQTRSQVYLLDVGEDPVKEAEFCSEEASIRRRVLSGIRCWDFHALHEQQELEDRLRQERLEAARRYTDDWY